MRESDVKIVIKLLLYRFVNPWSYVFFCFPFVKWWMRTTPSCWYGESFPLTLSAALILPCYWKWGSFLFKGSIWDLMVWVYFQRVSERDSGIRGWEEQNYISKMNLIPVRTCTWKIDFHLHGCPERGKYTVHKGRRCYCQPACLQNG